jgi:glycosyltransferase involved in cell wall biosynthesis
VTVEIPMYRACINKITQKLFGTTHVPAHGKTKGIVLLSYMTAPFTLMPWQYFGDPHTNYWECAEIARLFSQRGFAVDIIDSDNARFVPKKNYIVCIDTDNNLERFSKHLPNTTKIMHITSAYWKFQNEAEERRRKDVQKRRGVLLKLQRFLEPSRNPDVADILEGFGNDTIRATYAQFNKRIFPIPLSVSQEFDFPKEKDFDGAKKHFLWFGGGGAVLKGLDLVIEAFSKMPELTLHIMGPVLAEKDFCEVYSKELSLPNIHIYGRPRRTKNGQIFVNKKPISEIFDRCVCILYPTASDSASGSVLQAMHRGLIPLVTKESGIAEKAPVHFLTDTSIGSLCATVQQFSCMSASELKERSIHSWEYARKYNTKKSFSNAYAEFIDTILRLP